MENPEKNKKIEVIIILNIEELSKIVNEWLGSCKREYIIESKKYYSGDPKIKDRYFHYFKQGKKLNDDSRSNLKINNDFFGLLVDQKISYCLSNDIIVENFSDVIDINENSDILGQEASICGESWQHFYIDIRGNLKFKSMETENIIALYDETIEENLIGIIRLYIINKIQYADYYDDAERITYSKNSENNFEMKSRQTHFENGSFGMIPFVPLFNNINKQDDLYKIKALIDCYDIVISDFANNFNDFQELILFIKNYSENVSTEDAAAELMEWLKKYKVINVKQDGSIDILSREVPYQARKEFLEILRNNIFFFAKGVDIEQLSGSAITIILIKSRFANLDLKANQFIKQFKIYIKKVLSFLNVYNGIKKLDQFNINKVDITFNKNMIVNESEIIDNIVKSVDIISRETLTKEHPYVRDYEEEEKRQKEDDAEYLENENNSAV